VLTPSEATTSAPLRTASGFVSLSFPTHLTDGHCKKRRSPGRRLCLRERQPASFLEQSRPTEFRRLPERRQSSKRWSRATDSCAFVRVKFWNIFRDVRLLLYHEIHLNQARMAWNRRPDATTLLVANGPEDDQHQLAHLKDKSRHCVYQGECLIDAIFRGAL
jgi:hypothetical protein